MCNFFNVMFHPRHSGELEVDLERIACTIVVDGLQITRADILQVRRIILINKWSIFIILGGFYQDSLAQKEIISYGTGCKACPPGTYVDPSRAPGIAESDCLACPKGKMSCCLGLYHWLRGMQFSVHWLQPILIFVSLLRQSNLFNLI